MKFSKKLLIIFCFGILSVSCGIFLNFQFQSQQKGNNSSEKSQFLRNTYANFSNNSGSYFCVTDGFLYYFDYKSQKSSLVCSKPNCLHREPTEQMPKEMYCEAYTGYSPIFTLGDTLYTINSPLLGQRLYTITASNLDRTNQEVIIETEDIITSFYLYENNFYYVVDEYEIVDFEDGSSGTTGAHSSTLYVLNLENYSHEAIITLDVSFSSSIQFTGYHEDILYLQYIIHEEKITEENLDTVNSSVEYYSFSLKDHTIIPIFRELWNSYHMFICQKDSLIYLQYEDETRSGQGSICTYNLDTQELSTIISQVFYDQYADNKIIYYEMNLEDLEHTQYDHAEKTGYYYDLDTYQTVPFSYRYDYRICDEFDDYFIILYIDPNHGNSYWRYMLKSDYYNGNDVYISML